MNVCFLGKSNNHWERKQTLNQWHLIYFMITIMHKSISRNTIFKLRSPFASNFKKVLRFQVCKFIWFQTPWQMTVDEISNSCHNFLWTNKQKSLSHLADFVAYLFTHSTASRFSVDFILFLRIPKIQFSNNIELTLRQKTVTLTVKRKQ